MSTSTISHQVAPSCTLYGIINCDNMKKARFWLKVHGIPFHVHDYRLDGLDDALLDKLLSLHSWKELINPRGTVWKNLSEAERNAVVDNASAKALMKRLPVIIKRPVLVAEQGSIVGFDNKSYQSLMVGKEDEERGY